MKHYRIKITVIGAFASATLLAWSTPGLADGWHWHHHYKHHAHLAYVEYAPDNECRVGWWQTLRYGHVRPRWGAWCR